MHVNPAIKAASVRLLLASMLLNICLLCQLEVVAATESVNEPNMFIIAGPNVVKGFPVIVKVKARGPQVVPELDFYGEEADINVALVSTTTKDRYTIRSYQISDDDWGMPGEGLVGDGAHQFQVGLQENEERTMLFDLSCLRPGIRAGTVLDDVPPGNYELSVGFPSSGINSNSIHVEILAPSGYEKQFLERTSKLVTNDYLKNGSGVYWGRFLRVGLEISIDDWNRLGKVAQRQCQFHALLSKVLAPEAAVKDIKIEPLRSMPVPEYLKPEKEFLFIEMEKVSGKDVAEKASTLLQKNRGLTWRLEKVSSRGRNLLWPRDYSKWMRKVRDSIAK